MPRVPRGLRRGLHSGGADLPTVYILISLCIIGGVGWLQLSRLEEHLREQRAAAQEAAEALEAGSRQAGATARLHGGAQRASRLCAASLEAAGLLPDAQGRRAGTAGGEAVPAAALRAHLSRRQLYDAMEASLLDRGLSLAASTTQGVGLGDLFTRAPGSGALRPVLTEVAVPVRAIVLPLSDRQASGVLEAAVRSHLGALLPPHGLWVQDSSKYHSTLWHASTHLDPVPATPAEKEAEAAAVRGVAAAACPLRVVLERVVATPSGTVLACWQIAGGTDVGELRRRLAAALPRASRRQVVQDRSILYTTLARLVLPPRVDDRAAEAGGGGGGAAHQQQRQQQQQQRQQGEAEQQQVEEGGVAAGGTAAVEAAAAEQAAAAEEAAVLLQAAVDRMTAELCGLEASLDTLWFAEEFQKLALALGGRASLLPLPLQCRGGDSIDRR